MEKRKRQTLKYLPPALSLSGAMLLEIGPAIRRAVRGSRRRRCRIAGCRHEAAKGTLMCEWHWLPIPLPEIDAAWVDPKRSAYIPRRVEIDGEPPCPRKRKRSNVQSPIPARTA